MPLSPRVAVLVTAVSGRPPGDVSCGAAARWGLGSGGHSLPLRLPTSPAPPQARESPRATHGPRGAEQRAFVAQFVRLESTVPGEASVVVFVRELCALTCGAVQVQRDLPPGPRFMLSSLAERRGSSPTVGGHRAVLGGAGQLCGLGQLRGLSVLQFPFRKVRCSLGCCED